MATVVMMEMEEHLKPAVGPFTDEEANKRLISCARKILNDYSTTKRTFLVSYISKFYVILSLLFIALLIAGSQLTNRNSMIVEAMVLFLILCINGALYEREKSLSSNDMWRRLDEFLSSLEMNGISSKELNFSSNLPTIAISRVIRDGKVKQYPCNLIIKGDIVVLGLGEMAPARVRFEGSPNAKILERDQHIKPEDIPEHRNDISFENLDPNSVFKFEVLDSPIESIFKTCLSSNRPKTTVNHYLDIVEELFDKIVLWAALILSLLVNTAKLFLIQETITTETYFYYFGYLQVLCIAPLIPITIPSLLLASRSYCNAFILTLFDALQTSNTEFVDEEDIDEFDAVPAPTKDLKLPWKPIFQRFLDQFLKVNGSRIVRTEGLIESLAYATVFCVLDREGTITAPIPTIDQILLLKPDGDPIVLDVGFDPFSQSGIRFEDSDWNAYLKMLKPLGLLHLLCTECGFPILMKKRELHFKSNRFPAGINTTAARQACLCSLGFEVGFPPSIFDQFQKTLKINTFVKTHPILQGMPIYHYEIPSMHSTVVSQVDDSAGLMLQIFSEGSVNLIVESCADYWTGDGLETVSAKNEKQIYDFAHNAYISDMEVIGYAYRPIQNSSLIPGILDLSQSEPYYIEAKNYFKKSAKEQEVVAPPLDSAVNRAATLQRKGYRRGYSKVDNMTDMQDSQLLTELTKNQTFLCAASFVYAPKPNMIDFIEDLALAGIRFVYFSHAPERESKAYGERLGLEIDWNSCINLSPDTGNGKYLAIHDMKAQLPRGVDTIRDHIKNVDDIPLLVSLFAECTPSTTAEMIKIYQENGEVVCAIGSSLNDLNVPCFASADIGISVDPISILRNKKTGPVDPIQVAATFNSLPCGLNLHFASQFYCITQMIRDARSLAVNSIQAFIFFIGLNLSVASLVFLSYCALLPIILDLYQIFYILYVVGPLLIMSILFTPHLPDIMEHLPAKNAEHSKDLARMVKSIVIRFSVMPSIMCISLFWLYFDTKLECYYF